MPKFSICRLQPCSLKSHYYDSQYICKVRHINVFNCGQGDGAYFAQSAFGCYPKCSILHNPRCRPDNIRGPTVDKVIWRRKLLRAVLISEKAFYAKILKAIEVARFVFKFVYQLCNSTNECISHGLWWRVLSNSKTMWWFPLSNLRFNTSRDLAIRRLIGYWNGPPLLLGKLLA